tara:strand:+ start:207 stop:485 length:279 start_codon:yes stop_codon:yes gene_type:complete
LESDLPDDLDIKKNPTVLKPEASQPSAITRIQDQTDDSPVIELKVAKPQEAEAPKDQAKVSTGNLDLIDSNVQDGSPLQLLPADITPNKSDL